jgi:hypothetical protein
MFEKYCKSAFFDLIYLSFLCNFVVTQNKLNQRL